MEGMVPVNEGHISRDVLIAMHETPGIGWKTIRRLWEMGPRAALRPGITEKELRDLGLRPEAAAALAKGLSPERMEAGRRKRIAAGMKTVTWADPEYPEMLLQIGDPPPVLYCIGRVELLRRPIVGVVGTRGATAYGRQMAEELAAALSRAGVTVASGLARGIDTAAHRGALQGDGSTIAVLGLPADQIYPPDNRWLYREIADHGLLVSEAPPGTPYHTGMFPSRNRIISGLSLGVVIAEAPVGSGALLTAEYAITQDRPVFVIPAPVTSPRSRGGLELLREGTASVLLDAGDILKRFVAEIRTSGGPAAGGLPDDAAKRANSAGAASVPLTEQESAIYDLILDQPRTADELAAHTGMAAGQLHALLLALQMKGKIRRLPGAVFAAV